ncbi:uncharacterized protein LOC113352317 [Papaver somniferum]|uniref:uncharacterized protein LOC113352317 n=1 Tax=Papaver somniferum TaxID=3469 RepID=UPI000E6FAEE5|nr:uncharacterized protein LOC113352317 [Papaver somniferum]
MELMLQTLSIFFGSPWMVLLSCLNATFTKSVSASTLGLKTSKQVWDYLCKSLLHRQLYSIKQGNTSISEFLRSVKEIVDNLAADEDIVLHVLNGLNSKFDHFVVTAQHHETQCKFHELRSKLLHHEKWLQSKSHDSYVMLESTNAPSAFFSKKFGGYKNQHNGSS